VYNIGQRPKQVRRGFEYYYQRRVNVTDGSEAELNARVTGSREYSVRFEWLNDEKVLLANCDCPHASDGQLCKHLWATILRQTSTVI
jgi:uncharacterized Zn finger protein